ncbi:MAG: TonB family protein [Candidatus Sulfotelmatobacter sp.]
MSKPETWRSWEGRVVNGLTLQRWLGGSDHSAVFLTEIAGTPPQKAAIKLMEAEGGHATERQLSRLRATTKLSHPNLICVFQAGQCQIDGTSLVYVVMEFADEDLSQILPQRALSSAEVADLLPPVLGALSSIYRSGLVHSRIKPSNVLAAADRLKLSTDQVVSPTDQNSRRGRRDVYDAPETVAGMITTASDIWSLGVTIVAAFTQNPGFVQVDSPRDPSVPEIPEPFRSIARECLHVDPKQRCSIAQIETRLKGQVPKAAPLASPAVASKPAPKVAAAAPAVPISAGQSAHPRKRPAFPVTIAVAVVLACIFAFFYFHGSKPTAQSPESTPQATAPTPTPATPGTSEAPAPNKSANSDGEVRHQVLPEIPQSAKNTITGTIKVVVKTEVDTSGKVTSAAFKSAGSSRYFAERALNAAHRWEFSPPEASGQPQASTWLIQFRFRRDSTQASAQRVKR